MDDIDDHSGVFMVHTPGGIIEFLPHSHGQHYLGLKSVTNKEMILVITVQESYEGFTKTEVQLAMAARQLQGMLENPYKHDYKKECYVQT